MDSQGGSDLPEVKDFIQEKWSIVESERIAIEKEETRIKREARAQETRKKMAKNAVVTVYGIIGAFIGGAIGVAIAFVFGLLAFILLPLVQALLGKNGFDTIMNIAALFFIIGGLVLGAILGVFSKAKS